MRVYPTTDWNRARVYEGLLETAAKICLIGEPVKYIYILIVLSANCINAMLLLFLNVYYVGRSQSGSQSSRRGRFSYSLQTLKAS